MFCVTGLLQTELDLAPMLGDTLSSYGFPLDFLDACIDYVGTFFYCGFKKFDLFLETKLIVEDATE